MYMDICVTLVLSDLSTLLGPYVVQVLLCHTYKGVCLACEMLLLVQYLYPTFPFLSMLVPLMYSITLEYSLLMWWRIIMSSILSG